MEIMKTNKIALPHGFTMLARGLTQMEGVLADIAPSINMVEIRQDLRNRCGRILTGRVNLKIQERLCINLRTER